MAKPLPDPQGKGRELLREFRNRLLVLPQPMRAGRFDLRFGDGAHQRGFSRAANEVCRIVGRPTLWHENKEPEMKWGLPSWSLGFLQERIGKIERKNNWKHTAVYPYFDAGGRLSHTPVHASWLNQIEIYFSIVQRKVLTPNDFPALAEKTTLHFDLLSGQTPVLLSHTGISLLPSECALLRNVA